jgi:hypothetical protein
VGKIRFERPVFTDVINSTKGRYLTENKISLRLVNKMPAFQELQSSQKCVPCPSPESDEFNFHLLILFLKIRFKIKGQNCNSLKAQGYLMDHPFAAGAREVSLFQNF